jgi:hypothetical protein
LQYAEDFIGYLKKITSIFLIFLLLLDSCGFFIVYLELSHHFKQEASSKINDFIPDNQLEIIAFHLSELTKTNSPLRILENDEIKINEALYDVYKKEIKGDSVYFYCINDANENILETAFTIYVDTKTQDTSKNIPLHNILVNIFKVAIVPLEINYSYNQSSIKFTTHIDYLFTQYAVDIPTPPPKS